MTRTLTAILSLIVLSPAASAAIERSEVTRRETRPPRLAGDASVAVDPASPGTAGRRARRFTDHVGGSWRYRIDPRTGRFAMVQGSGVPLFAPDKRLEAAAIEPRARRFLATHGELVEPSRGDLRWNPDVSVTRGRLTSVYYDWVVGGVPVEGATVFARVNSGNVTQFGSRFIGTVETPTIPELAAEQAVAALMRHSGDADSAKIVRPPKLWLQPEEVDGVLTYRLIWTLRYTTPSGIETWEGRVDAHTGEVVGFRDVNLYAHASGGVFGRNPRVTDETRLPLFDLTVTHNGNRVTDLGGQYAYTGGFTTSSLRGLYFRVICQNCSNPAQPSVQATFGTGRIDFGMGGTDHIGNGASSRPGRNAFYHQNRVRTVAQGWLPGLGWLNTFSLTTNVNVSGGTCQAFYNGSTNYQRSGQGCINPAESSDVVYHEWGHGIDVATIFGDQMSSEGTADVMAVQMSRDFLVGPNYWSNGAPVRNFDWRSSPRGLMTWDRVQSGYCNILPGGGLSPHCAGETYGQVAYELAVKLIVKHGFQTGWRTSERLFFTSLPDAGVMDPASAINMYDAYLFADDDDGNLANGTPNGAEIYDAFELHGLATGPAVSTPGCQRPEQPTVTVTPECDAIALDWTGVDGAEGYRVLRAELSPNKAYLKIAELGSDARSHVDPEVGPDVSYWYVVEAVDAVGCPSQVEGPVATRLPSQPQLELSAITVDDTARGNGTGVADPGEEVDLFLTLTNHGTVTAAGVRGTLTSSTPGVDIVRDASGWPTMAPAADGDNLQPLRLRLSPDVPCGSLVQLRLTPGEDTGCSDATSFLQFIVGERIGSEWVCSAPPTCLSPPLFDGISSAAPGAGCGEIALDWDAAGAACDPPASYSIYRSEDPAFTPGPQSRIGSSLGVGFVDAALPTGTEFTYVVRVRGEAGDEDANLVRRTTLSGSGPECGICTDPVEAPALLAVARAGDDVVLDWQGQESTDDRYVVYALSGPSLGQALRVGSTPDPTFTHPSAARSATAFFYRVSAVDACGNESPR